MHTQSNFRLLVVRLGAMGDILHALPAVTALRLAHPSWQIGWVVEPRWQALLSAGTEGPRDRGNTEERSGTRQIAHVRGSAAMPVVDRLHFAAEPGLEAPSAERQDTRQIKELRRELRAADYDAVLDLQGAIRSAVIGRMSGCARRIGEARPREWPAHWLFTERIVTHGAHVIEQDVELASAVAGDALSAAAPLLPVDAEAEAWCGDVARGHIAPAQRGRWR